MSGPGLTDLVPVVVKEALETDGSELRVEVERAVESAVEEAVECVPDPSSLAPASFAAYDCTDFQVGHKIFINEVSLKVDALPQTINGQHLTQGSKDPILENKGINKKKLLVSAALLLAITIAVCVSVFVNFHPEVPIESDEDWPSNSSIHLITREVWGALPPATPNKLLKTSPAKYVILSHTVSSPCSSIPTCSMIVRNTQADHISLDMGDIGFNFLVGGDGNVYTGRGWNIWGAHTPLFNSVSLGVALIGDFTFNLPPKRQIDAVLQLIQIGVQLGKLSKDFKLYGMNQVSSTESPGKPLSEVIKKWPHWSPYSIYDR